MSAIIVALVLLNMVVFWMWRSSVAEYQRLSQGVTEVVEVMQGFHQQQPIKMRGVVKAADPLMLMKTVEQIAKRGGMEQLLTTIEQRGSGLTLTFDQVRFSSIVGWLLDLENEGLQIISIIANQTDKAGMTSVEIVVR